MIQPAIRQGAAPVPTAFAPAERATADDVRRQHHKLAGLPFVQQFLDAMPNMAVALNAQRQIVLANRALLAYFEGRTGLVADAAHQRDGLERVIAGLLGKRPGEALNCVHAHETVGGCGTTVFCRNCGAANAIVNSQRLNLLDVQECRLVAGGSGAAEQFLDFRVWAQPIEVEGESFTVFSLVDISSEKRRDALERIFFHDVMNTAGGMKGLADLLVDTDLPAASLREVAEMMSDSASHLIDEIGAQRALSAAENGDLQVSLQVVESVEMLDHVIRQFHSYRRSRGQEIRVTDASESVPFVTDPHLLRRVLVNLVKNALEAEAEGSVVTLTTHAERDAVVFTVHNPTAMPPHVQQQIFQRSYSTKGTGRGLGTYSVRLLTERYLNAHVWFESDEAHGTTFSVRCPRELAASVASR